MHLVLCHGRKIPLLTASSHVTWNLQSRADVALRHDMAWHVVPVRGMGEYGSPCWKFSVVYCSEIISHRCSRWTAIPPPAMFSPGWMMTHRWIMNNNTDLLETSPAVEQAKTAARCLRFSFSLFGQDSWGKLALTIVDGFWRLFKTSVDDCRDYPIYPNTLEILR